MTRVLLLAVASALLLATPARGQSTDEAIEELIAKLGDEDRKVRRSARGSLAEIGAPAIPALVAELPDPDFRSKRGSGASMVLGEIGPRAVPALVEVLDANASVPFDRGSFDADSFFKRTHARVHAESALEKIARDAKKKGTVLWWVVPRVYWKQLTGLLLLLAAWFALLGRFPKHRPVSRLKHLALMAVTAAVPVALACSAVLYAITREWAEGFLPDALTLVPFPVAAVLSVALVCTLPAAYVCQRKPLRTAEEIPTPQP